MESKFHANGVITGIADSFCLSCQKYLKMKDIHQHITDSSHQKTFQATSYVEKYKEDRIRKVKMGYYCEVCNLMIQTSVKIDIHVNEVSHITNKNTQFLKNCDEGVVAFDDVLIEESAWHGLADGSCLICNIDYSDKDAHKNEPTHILKLIQSKFEINQNKYVYRKIDDESFNCLVCNSLIAKESKELHMDESEHKKNYIKCQKFNKYHLQTVNQNDIKAGNDVGKNIASGDVATASANCIDSKDKLVNDEELADSPDLQTQVEVYNKDTQKRKDDDEVLPPGEALKKAIEFAKQNNLKYKRNSTYCKSCDVRISSSLKMMKEHVAEASHKDKVNKTSKKMNKIPMLMFIECETSVQNIFFHDIVINNEICISMFSFLMMSRHNGRIRCYTCEVTLDSNELESHKFTYKHITAMRETPVLTDFKSEFVREVRPKVYHCGYCNFIESSLDGLKNHLVSTDHYEKKSAALRRLQSYLPEIMEERGKQVFFGIMRKLHQM